MFLQLQGKIVASAKKEWIKVSEIQNPNTKGLTNDTSNLIVFSNVTNLSIDGSGGSIDGYGSSWWECKSCGRPTV